jgi:hypothetical protein
MALEDNQIVIDGKTTIDSALQLIRYDIPCFILGKSSIGKSYTLIKITERWHIPHQLLYIGSEKAENIEGIPKLTDRGQNKDGSDKEIMEYLQPYWFPNPKVITESVKNGRSVFERFVSSAWEVKGQKKFTPNYMNLHSILNGLENLQWNISQLNKSSRMYIMDATLVDNNWVDVTGVGSANNNVSKPRVLNPNKLFTLEKDATPVEPNDNSYYKDDLKDFCAYLRTVLGYGNYWLILDEIDKVESHDKDKFAPLLHIVRERTLKNFSMIDINEGKGLGIPLGKSFQEGGYANMIKDVNTLLDTGESVLDTRVIAIANKSENIEEALFRRFCHLIAMDILIWRKQDISTDESDVTRCLTKIKDEQIQATDGDFGSLIIGDDLVKRIDEVNLQWEYNFLPKMMNKYDLQGNYFKNNAIDKMEQASNLDMNWRNEKQTTAFYALLQDNFHSEGYNIGDNLFDCLETSLLNLNTSESIGVVSKVEKIKGLKGVYEEKIQMFNGDMTLAAIDIAESRKDLYPSTGTDDADKLNALYTWTDEIIRRLDACIFYNETTVQPIPFASFLVPALTQVFYTQIAQDENWITDNASSAITMFQSFWGRVFDAKPDFELICDKSLTEVAFYGGSAEDLDSIDDKLKEKVSKDTFYGANPNFWNQSSSGIIVKKEMRSQMTVALPNLSTPNVLGVEGTIDKLMENEGAIIWLSEEFASELAEIQKGYIEGRDNAKKASNAPLRKRLNDAQTVIKTILE